MWSRRHLEAVSEERLVRGGAGEEADRIHEMRPLYFLDSGARHIRLAVRTLLRNKGAYLAASGILALGIGMSVAMFSLVDAILLRPLPFPRQESIQLIWK